MKSIQQLVIICLLIFSTENIFPQTAADYYMPLNVGNQLNLYAQSNSSSWTSRDLIYSIVGTDMVDGYECYRQVGVEILVDNQITHIDTFRIFWFREDVDGNVILSAVNFNGCEDPDSAMILNFSYFPNEYLTVGYSRNYSFGDNSKDSILSITETVTVPAGTFNNCLEILETHYDDFGNLIYSENRYYAQGVGKVKTIRTLPTNDMHTSYLTSYNITGLDSDIENQGPNNYILSQNYPNPFNPGTVISYQLPVNSNVTLKVYDVLGNEIATLVDEFKQAGSYKINCDGSVYSTGIYFYKLTAGTFSETRKMLLMK